MSEAKSKRRRGSPEEGPGDPFQIWREWLDRAERQWNETLIEAMDSEHYARSQSRLMELFSSFQASMNAATSRYFSTLNLATRTDLLGIGERLGAIEERLAEIESALRGDPSPPSRTRRKPARTKRPPSRTPEPGGAGREERSAGARAGGRTGKKTKKTKKTRKSGKTERTQGKRAGAERARRRKGS